MIDLFDIKFGTSSIQLWESENVSKSMTRLMWVTKKNSEEKIYRRRVCVESS